MHNNFVTSNNVIELLFKTSILRISQYMQGFKAYLFWFTVRLLEIPIYVSQFRLQPQTSWNLDDSIEKVATWNRTWSFQTLSCNNTPGILEKTRRNVALKQDKNSSWRNWSIQHELGRHLYAIFWPCHFLELSKRPFFCTNGNEQI